MNTETVEIGQLWVLRRDDVTVLALVVRVEAGCLVVWPATAASEQSLVIWPALATGVDLSRAVQLLTRLLPEDEAVAFRQDHRDTEALLADWSTGRLAFGGTSPWKTDRHQLIDQMAVLGE